MSVKYICELVREIKNNYYLSNSNITITISIQYKCLVLNNFKYLFMKLV